jgi:ABC-type branched-subunit amino acid transport system substrate-binding protein
MMTASIPRRTLLQELALLGASAPLAATARHWRPPITLRLGLVESNGSSAAARARRMGLDLGIDDAKHAGGLFGGTVELRTLAAGAVRGSGLSAILGGSDESECTTLARVAQDAGVLYLNASCTSDALRGADCRDSAFHIAPSDAMLRDALAQMHAAPGARAAAWAGSLVRYGADTLNDRFRTHFHTDMDPDSWGAWMAVKVLWESSLRARSTDAAKLADYLTRDTTQFDGYKGRALSFRAWDHQLRQPVYLFTGSGSTEKLVAEAPAATTADEATRDLLDRLGTTAARTSCRMKL